MKSHLSKMCKNFYSIQSTIKPKICIVGAGPAGFYAAQHLLKKIKEVHIDIIERFPVPFGLVRYGVAPDHPEVKNVINTFTKVAENPKVRFYGNVNLGETISLQQLKEAYHIILLTYGADESRSLTIPGENLPNVIPAKDIVGWYNGVPGLANLRVDLNCENVVIFGQGNVALDVARILLSPIDKLRKTDITNHALEALSKSKIKEIKLVGRRGPLQAAFTIKEFREILNLEKCSTNWQPQDFDGIKEIIPQLARPRKRLTELMLSSLDKVQTDNACRKFYPVFFRSPLQFLKDNSENVKYVIVGVNQLVGDDFLKKNAVLTEFKEQFDCGLGVTSIGYRSVPADKALPFDEKRGIISNKNGKVEEGVYASGWLATGSTGVILSTMSNAFGTAEEIAKDVEKGNLISEPKPGFAGLQNHIKVNNSIVTWEDWLKIDKYEQNEGKRLGKPREKILRISKMLEIAL